MAVGEAERCSSAAYCQHFVVRGRRLESPWKLPSGWSSSLATTPKHSPLVSESGSTGLRGPTSRDSFHGLRSVRCVGLAPSSSSSSLSWCRTWTNQSRLLVWRRRRPNTLDRRPVSVPLTIRQTCLRPARRYLVRIRYLYLYEHRRRAISVQLLLFVFLPREAMQSAGYAVARCLSVRLSVLLHVRFVYCVKTSSHIFIFSPTGSHKILVFFIPNIMTRFRWGPPNGGVECRWGVKKSLFSTNIKTLHHVLSTVRLSVVVNSVPPDRGKLVTLIFGSIKRRRLLIAWNGQRSATHQWFLFMTESLDVKQKSTEQNLIVLIGLVAALRIGNAFDSINVVTLRRAQLVPDPWPSFDE